MVTCPMWETQETQVRSLSQKIPWKEMATHSNILAWEIPWTKQPGGLQTMGSQRVWIQLRIHACDLRLALSALHPSLRIFQSLHFTVMAFELWDYIIQVKDNGSIKFPDLSSVTIYLEDNLLLNLYLASAKNKLCFSTFAEILQ